MDENHRRMSFNKRANIYNNGIRAQILWREDELNTGDFADGSKNNTTGRKEYFANGEVLHRMRRPHVRTFPFCGFCSRGFELEVNLLLDTLHSDAPALLKRTMTGCFMLCSNMPTFL